MLGHAFSSVGFSSLVIISSTAIPLPSQFCLFPTINFKIKCNALATTDLIYSSLYVRAVSTQTFWKHLLAHWISIDLDANAFNDWSDSIYSTDLNRLNYWLIDLLIGYEIILQFE